MGLNVYAGTLTRYYCNNWKTAVQQWAEANGHEFRRVSPDGKEIVQEKLTPEEIDSNQRVLEDWRDSVLSVISKASKRSYEPWQEDNEKPYYTDKPDWEAVEAMMLVAAYSTYGEPVPPTLEKGCEFMSHPLIQRLAQDRSQLWTLLWGTTWWLPLPDVVLFKTRKPTGRDATIATVAALRQELERLNALAWKADEETILSWSETEGYPIDGVYGPDGKLDPNSIQEHTQYDTQSLAKFAFSIFWQAVKFAQAQQVPILLDD